MFTALIGMMLAGSRLLYSFGRDGLLPSWLSQLNHKHLPNRALVFTYNHWCSYRINVPVCFLSTIDFRRYPCCIHVCVTSHVSIKKTRRKDLPKPEFKLPLYPILPAITFILVLLVFWGLSFEAKLYTLIWFIVGIIIYLIYGIRHSKRMMKKRIKYLENK